MIIQLQWLSGMYMHFVTSIFQVQLFHLNEAYKGYMGVTYMSIVSPIYVPCKSRICRL